MRVEDKRTDKILQVGPFEWAKATEMVGAVEKEMCLSLGGLTWAQQLFDIEAFVYVVW